MPTYGTTSELVIAYRAGYLGIYDVMDGEYLACLSPRHWVCKFREICLLGPPKVRMPTIRLALPRIR